MNILNVFLFSLLGFAMLVTVARAILEWREYGSDRTTHNWTMLATVTTIVFIMFAVIH